MITGQIIFKSICFKEYNNFKAKEDLLENISLLMKYFEVDNISNSQRSPHRYMRKQAVPIALMFLSKKTDSVHRFTKRACLHNMSAILSTL